MLLEQLEPIHLFESAQYLENGPGAGLAWAELQLFTQNFLRGEQAQKPER